MLQDTVVRLQGVQGARAPIIVSNAEHRFLVAEQLREIGVKPEVQILEPVGRNTAPAVAVAALYVQSRQPDACLFVLPSDHLIQDVPAFHAAIATALPLAAGGSLVTFGITPRGPVTGYGYLERGEPISGSKGSFQVARFVEKPDPETALQLHQKLIDLGEANDVRVAEEIVAELARDGGATIAHAGKIVLDWHKRRVAEREPKTREHLRRLLAAEPFWRGR